MTGARRGLTVAGVEAGHLGAPASPTTGNHSQLSLTPDEG